MKGLFFVTAILSIICVVIICIFLFSGGIPAISQIGLFNFLGGVKWNPDQNEYGILPMILGSIYVTGGAIVIAAPIGILTSVFLVRFCPKKFYKPLESLVNLMAGIPSIIYGFFAMMVMLPFLNDAVGAKKTGNLLCAAILLGIMVLPTIISVSVNAIKQVDGSYFEGAVALGASKERAVFLTELPAARSGILAGVVLGIGRAVGETMAVVMIIGNQTVIPTSILKGARTLTTNIVLEMGEAFGLHRDSLIATAVVLFVFVLLINLSFSAIRIHNEKKGN